MSKAQKILAGASAFVHLALVYAKANSKEAKILKFIGDVVDAYLNGQPIPDKPAGI